MNMKIGEIIKKLRKERDVTQEKLADYLGISYQAVSKWENGTALPDITLVVPLANFFGVSTDELFSLNEQVNDEKVKEYEEKCRKLFNLGDMPACVELMREALSEYPRNFNFMKQLAHALHWKNYSPEHHNTDTLDEIIQLCERILEDCTDNNIRYGTMQTLCEAYRDAGQIEKAIKTAKEMPFFSASSDWLLSNLYEGYARIQHKQANILFCVWFAAVELNKLAYDYEVLEPDCDKRIMHLEAALKLYETIFYDGNALYYHIWIDELCKALASAYMKKDFAKAMEYLLMSEKHALANDAITDEPMFYTSIFADKIAHSTANTLKSSTETSCEQLLRYLDNECFAPLRDNPEFTALKERLTERQKSTGN